MKTIYFFSNLCSLRNKSFPGHQKQCLCSTTKLLPSAERTVKILKDAIPTSLLYMKSSQDFCMQGPRVGPEYKSSESVKRLQTKYQAVAKDIEVETPSFPCSKLHDWVRINCPSLTAFEPNDLPAHFRGC